MARQLRTEYEGAIYHMMNRGDRGVPTKPCLCPTTLVAPRPLHNNEP